MEEPIFIELTVQGMILVLIFSMPAILLATFTGLVVSFFQTLTQIQKQTLGVAVKLRVTMLALIFMENFMTAELFN